ncbi:MAG: MBL fold metallo-hydrolase [Edaphobacter sp.]|uniref:MBL fold metallo-hydrolase n=1 Tax=Edaphobacter sp. TaxID=1934404 RepID=UPI0023A172F3|nr:MBL fold metallo-hydrolase [Edaphobacter sp.]MDE1175793.1 MBL fold metallo-hydrolase [Edaphobacter sp.]
MNAYARRLWQQRPFVLTKLGQLWRLVRESHEQPITGDPRPPELVSPGQLGITFIGHSSFFLQIGGKNVLIDPVFSRRLILLRRQSHPGALPSQLPPIDLVLVTHAHMDHLDLASLRLILRSNRRARYHAPEIVVPAGVDDLVASHGFRQVHTLSWWQQMNIGNLTLTMTPCRHWGARMFRDTHRGYGGYVISSGEHSVYHSGDTAWFDGFAEIGQRLHPRVALLPIGAYFPDSYRTVHVSPEEAVQGFLACGAEQMIPMHFGAFRLGREPMGEPEARLQAEAAKLGISDRIRILAEGETLLLP